jgi:hypothetical protein
MFYSGESNVPGAPGNLFAGGNFMGGAGSAINPEAFKRDARQQKIYNKGVGTDNPNEKEIFLQRTGPQLPFAYQGGTSFPIAQAYPGGQAIGNAGVLGGPMEMGPRLGPRPLNLNINAADDRVESIGGSANIQLDPNQTLRLGANFNPAYTDELGMQTPQGYSIYGSYETPGLGVNVNYRNTGRRTNPVPGAGFPGELTAGFKGRF